MPDPAPMGTPPPALPRQDHLTRGSELPTKKDLVDEDDVTGVEYGSKNKAPSQAKAQGAKALRIKLNTGTGTGGVNTGGTVV